MAAAVRAQEAAILAANAEDVGRGARRRGRRGAFLDRLALDAARVEAIAAGIEVVRALKDPVGIVTESWTRPNGMRIERVRVPLGVIGIIYESRPNVTADAGVLCLKAGNAAILRGGSDSMRSSRAILAALARGPARGRPAGGSDPACPDPRPRRGRADAARARRQYRRDRVRAAARAWWRACRPKRACRCSRTSKGSAMSIVHSAASLDMAKKIVLNAKMRRTGVCGAAETLLVDRGVRRHPPQAAWSRC